MKKTMLITALILANSVSAFANSSMAQQLRMSDTKAAVAAKSEALEIIEEQLLRVLEQLEVLHNVALDQGDVETMRDINAMMKKAEMISKMDNETQAEAEKHKLINEMATIEAFLVQFEGK